MKFYWDSVYSEKNIEMRKRQEDKIKRDSNIFLAVLFAGGFASISLELTGILLTLFVLLLWIFNEKIFLPDYQKYTDKLIREKRTSN